MTDQVSKEELTLSVQLVSAIVELIDFYSKKSVFKINEYKDIATINERLSVVLTALNESKEYEALTTQELAYILLIFKEGTNRIPTAVESFGQLFGIYQHYKSLLEQELAKEEEKKTADETSKKSKKKGVPRIEELEQ